MADREQVNASARLACHSRPRRAGLPLMRLGVGPGPVLGWWVGRRHLVEKLEEELDVLNGRCVTGEPRCT